MEVVDESEGALDAKRASDVEVSDSKGPVDVVGGGAKGPTDDSVSDAKEPVDVMGGGERASDEDAKMVSDVETGDKAAGGWGEPAVAPEVLDFVHMC